MSNSLGPLRLVPLLIAFLMVVMFPVGTLGATWQVKDDSGFKTTGHVTNDISIQDHHLKLAFEDNYVFQKTWTGTDGQNQFQTPTRFFSKTGLDGSSSDGLMLEKESWIRLADSPTARKEHIAVYDAPRQQIIVFGGQNASGSMTSTWAYKPSTDSWAQLADGPISRYWQSGAWDLQEQQLIIHGGMSSVGGTIKSYNDTITFDPATGSWVTRTNATLKRYSHSAVWDPTKGRMLVFGGYAGGAISKDLWAYEPIGNTWEQKASAPVSTYEHSAIWADGLNKMLIYGGLKSGGISSKDLWAYDPGTNTWSQLANGGTERSGQAVAWNTDAKQLIMTGGHSGQSDFNDTWIYDGATNTWRQGKTFPGTARTGSTLIWSPEEKVAVLYGGEDENGLSDEVWAYSPNYFKNGELVSSSYDMGAAPVLTNISWTVSANPSSCSGTSVKVQLAGSLTLDASSYTFSGPDGPTSYYTIGQTISSDLTGKKYLRYKVFLSTTDLKCTPVLKELRIGYRDYLPAGDYISAPFDTGSNSVYLISSTYKYDDPSGTAVLVYFRSAYTADMTGASNWELLVPKDSGIKTPPRRYVQFKVALSSTDPARTPTVDSFELVYNSVPQMLTSPVAPDSGGTATEFVYRVVYIDGDGETPTSYKVYIDDKEHDMQPQTYDYRIGANFTFPTKLASGAHTYKFEFSDGKNTTVLPASGVFKGPTVNDIPTALLKIPSKATKGKKVTFDASSSTDPEGKMASYRFDFGDGTESGWVNSSKVTHSYKKTGNYKTKVTVKDNMGGQAVSAESTVKVEEAKGFIPFPGSGAVLIALVASAIAISQMRRARRWR